MTFNIITIMANPTMMIFIIIITKKLGRSLRGKWPPIIMRTTHTLSLGLAKEFVCQFIACFSAEISKRLCNDVSLLPELKGPSGRVRKYDEQIKADMVKSVYEDPCKHLVRCELDLQKRNVIGW